MRIRKTTPPVAAPLTLRDLLSGLKGCMDKDIPGQLEEEVRRYFHADHVFFLSSGKAAFFLILCALKKLVNRKKVVIPAYTCYSVPSAIVKSGLEIVLCDVNPGTLDFDYTQLEHLADDKTLCIVSTHLFGIPCDIDRTRRICDEKGIFLVEDAAQAMGMEHGGRKLGSTGDVGFFSLGRGKNITCGTGGIIVTRSEEVAAALQGPYKQLEIETLSNSVKSLLELSLMQFFMNPYLYWLPDGLPILKIGETHFNSNFSMFRLSRAKVGLLYNWKQNLDALNNYRVESAEEYKNMLGLDRKLLIYSKVLPYLRFPVYLKSERIKENVCGNYRYLGVSPMYPASICGVNEIKNQVIFRSCSNSDKIARTLITLPTHQFTDGILREKICTLVRNSLECEFLNQ